MLSPTGHASIHVISAFQVGSGEVFSIDEPVMSNTPATLEEEEDEDEWQDVEVSEEWGPQTPMTPLNDDPDDTIHMRSSRHDSMEQQRYQVGLLFDKQFFKKEQEKNCS